MHQTKTISSRSFLRIPSTLRKPFEFVCTHLLRYPDGVATFGDFRSNLDENLVQVGFAEWIKHPLLMLGVRTPLCLKIPLLYREAKWLLERPT